MAFLRYWNNPSATAKKVVNNWLLTGDVARMDEDGFLFFNGRDDDVIKSSGYRIGPSEVEHSVAQVCFVFPVCSRNLFSVFLTRWRTAIHAAPGCLDVRGNW